MRSRTILSLTMGVILVCAGSVRADMREYTLGDIDGGAYNGAGSIDDVYYDTGFGANGHIPPIVGFDIWSYNSGRPFTFLFELTQHEKIVSAELTLGLNAASSLITTDTIHLESYDNEYSYVDLGWLPIATDTEFVTRTLDLGDVLGDSFLPLLQDGQLNVLIKDDTVIDYATLKLDVGVAPVPGAAILGSIGLGLAGWRLRRREESK